MKPLLSYYGGKQRIASKILQYFPPHTTYCEPFAGGATLLFLKPEIAQKKQDQYIEAINDIDQAIANFYRVAVSQSAELKALIDATLYNQHDHQKAKEILRDSSEKYSELEKAWACYVQLNQSYACKMFGGWGFGLLGNRASVWRHKKDRLNEQLKRIEKVHIGCEDALRFIKRWDSPQTLFYCDPPYPETNQGHYSGYGASDFKLLCETLDRIQGSYVLSCYQIKGIEPKTAQKKVEIDATMSASSADLRLEKKNTKRTECLWICDRSGNVNRQDIRKDITANQKAMNETWRDSSNDEFN